MEEKADERDRLPLEKRVAELRQSLSEFKEENKTLKEENARLKEENRKWLYIAGTMDSTGLPNRILFLKAVLPVELRKTLREKVPLSCMMLTPDNVGQVNQTHGRQIGDRFIRGFADFLKKRLEGRDRLFHVDGANFLILCPSTDLTGLKKKALLLRQGISSEIFYLEDVQVTTTVSLGAASFEDSETGDIPALVDRVYWRLTDTLDKARGKGGDRIEIHRETEF